MQGMDRMISLFQWGEVAAADARHGQGNPSVTVGAAAGYCLVLGVGASADYCMVLTISLLTTGQPGILISASMRFIAQLPAAINCSLLVLEARPF